MAYIGKAALTLVRVDNTLAYVYAGEPVPGGADEADVARLVDEGFIVKLDFPAVEPVDEQPADGDTTAEPASVPPAKKTAAPRRS